MSIKEFVKEHFDFNVYIATIVSAIIAIAVIPCEIYFPYRYGFENGIIENMQLIFLFLGVFLALKAPKEKKFFYFVAMVLGILILREVNCGRTLFFGIPGQENAYYSWSEIPYGWLAHVFFGIYIALVGLYFIINKLWLNVWELLTKIKLPFWHLLFIVISIFWGEFSEATMNDDVFEEMMELLFYVSITGMIYLYGFTCRTKE